MRSTSRQSSPLTLRALISRSWEWNLARLGVITLALVMFAGGCDSTGDDAPSTSVTPSDGERTAILISMRQHVLVPLTQSFLIEGQALSDAIERRDLAESRAAWRVAMRAWHRLEMIQVGPAGVAGSRLGGADLRDHIYSFPLSSACRVEQEWLAQEFGAETWADEAPYQVKGLDALEHLLFKEGVEPACPAQAQIVRDNLWDAFVMGSDVYEEARWAYASAVMADVVRRAQSLADEWRGSFGDTFERAESPFSAERDAVDQLFAAIFYLDLSVKDRKIGGPVGLHMTCLEETCPELIEHRASGFGRAALIANLEGFLAVMRGSASDDEDRAEMTSSPFGLSALLAQEGATEAADELERLARDAIAQLEASELTLNELLERDPEMLRQVYATTREMAELLKTQVVTTLNLSVPQEGAGDND